MNRRDKHLSRREFARRATLSTAAATASLIPLPGLGTARVATDVEQAPLEAPDLPAQARAEAEARYQSILAKYSDRFSDAQKADLSRLSFALQPQLDRLRAWPVANSDQPALYFKPLVEREKKSNAAPNLKSPAASPAKSKENEKH